MSTLHLLYRDSYEINDSIRIVVPTVGQVLDNEDTYYNIVSAITAMPIDFMVQLDDLGIDFTTINAWQLFVLLFENLKQMDKYDLSLVFGDLDLSCFEIGISPLFVMKSMTSRLIEQFTARWLLFYGSYTT